MSPSLNARMDADVGTFELEPLDGGYSRSSSPATMSADSVPAGGIGGGAGPASRQESKEGPGRGEWDEDEEDGNPGGIGLPSTDPDVIGIAPESPY